MGFLLKPAMLTSDQYTAADIQKLMKNDLKNNAGKTGVKFVAAKNYVIKGKTINLLIVTDTPALFEEIIKKQTKALRAKGTLDLTKDKVSGKTKVSIKTSSGQMLVDGVVKLMPLVTGNDASVEAETTIKAPAVHPGQDKEVAPGKKVSDIVKASYAEANKAGEEARQKGADMSKPGVHQMTGEMPALDYLDMLGKTRGQVDEFMRFAEMYRKLASKYNFEDDGLTIPGAVWLAMIKNMKNSGYVAKNLPKGPDGRFLLRVDGPGGKQVREALLEKGIQGMQVFISHAEKNLDKVVTEVKKSGTKTWAFWSGGKVAELAAKKYAGGGLVLEGSVGSWFEKIWSFEHLTGVSDMILWTSMSEMYARKAAENYAEFSFLGYMGPGATKETTVWKNIEQPALIEVLNVQKQLPVPKVRWFVCRTSWTASPTGRDTNKKTGETGTWTGLSDAPDEMGTRLLAEAECIKRWGE